MALKALPGLGEDWRVSLDVSLEEIPDGLHQGVALSDRCISGPNLILHRKKCSRHESPVVTMDRRFYDTAVQESGAERWDLKTTQQHTDLTLGNHDVLAGSIKQDEKSKHNKEQNRTRQRETKAKQSRTRQRIQAQPVRTLFIGSRRITIRRH